MSLEFTAPLELHGKTATGVEVPADILDELGGGRRPAVTATINGYSWRTSIGAMGGRSLVPVSAEVRERASVTAGELVHVALELDTAPREAQVPDDLAAALEAQPAAAQAFARLSYSNQRQRILSVEAAKTAPTRERRIATVVQGLLD